MHTKLADVDDTRPPERFTLQSTGARRRSPRRTTPFRTRKWPCGHGTAPSAPQQVQARIRSSSTHWLSQEDDALVYAREVHMDCSRVRCDADDRADLVDIGIFPLEECPHPKMLSVELIRTNLDILRRRHKWLSPCC